MAPLLLAADDNFGLSYLLEVVGFVLFLAVIVRYVVPFLRTRMEIQAQAIQAALNAGEEARASALELLRAARAALAEAEQEAARIVSQANVAAERIRADAQRKAEEEKARIAGRLSAEIEAERTRTRDEIVEEVGSLVVTAAERVVLAELDEIRHRRFIDEAIAATESETF